MSSPQVNDKSVVAKILCDLQPRPIRDRLVSDADFAKRFGIKALDIFNLNDVVRIDHMRLFASARHVLTDRKPLRLADLDGRSFQIEVTAESVVLSALPDADRRWSIPFPELTVLSPHQGERCSGMARLLKVLGPAVPDFEGTRAAAESRDLTDEEVSALISERISGVAALQDKIARALVTGGATASTLFPADHTYYERFCGPEPVGTDIESYLRDVLPKYRRQLLDRDLAQGLQICLQGALRDDLSPGAWTADLPDEALWVALESCESDDNPFVLLGALDVALYNPRESRYVALAKRAIDSLVQESLRRPDAVDVYELMPLLAELTLHKLNTQERGVVRAPSWKRMCAWMHAGVVTRAMARSALNWTDFREWASDQLSLAGHYAGLLDLRREPMYRAMEMSAERLRHEVLGRLVGLKRRFEAAGRTIPNGEKLVQLLSSVDPRSLLDWSAPGPLEGHRRPAQMSDRRIREDDATRLIADLGSEVAFLSTLAHLSQTFDLGDNLLAHARAMVANVSTDASREVSETILWRLSDGCLAACAQKDTEFARAIAKLMVSQASLVTTRHGVAALLNCLILASTAFEDDEEWGAWFEEQLAAFAFGLRRGDPTRAFLDHLTELKSVVQATLCVHGRAEAIASAAE